MIADIRQRIALTDVRDHLDAPGDAVWAAGGDELGAAGVDALPLGADEVGLGEPLGVGAGEELVGVGEDDGVWLGRGECDEPGECVGVGLVLGRGW